MRPAELAKRKFSELVELSGAVMALQDVGEKLGCFSWSERSMLNVLHRQISEALQIREAKQKSAP